MADSATTDERAPRIVSGNGDVALSSVDVALVGRLFRESGAVLIRGYPHSATEFRAFTDQFGKQPVSYIGGTTRRRRIDDLADHLSVTPGTFPIPAHSEMSYYRRRPPLVFFRCAEPSPTGGQTALYDGLAIYAHAPTWLRTTLSQNHVSYFWIVPEYDWRGRYGVDSREAFENLARELEVDLETAGLAPNRVAYIHSRVPGVDSIYQSTSSVLANHIIVSGIAEKHGTRGLPYFRLGGHDAETSQRVCETLWTLADQHAIEINWEKHDVLMVDNTRFMHGRRKFTGPRDVQVRMYRAPKTGFWLWR